MPLILICAKCGGEINITDEMLDEAKESGKPFSVVHDVCPKDAEPKDNRRFRVVVAVYEKMTDPDIDNPEDWEEEKVAQFGGEYEGESFEATLPKLQQELNKGWEQVQKLASMIDAPQTPVLQKPTTTPDSTPVDGAEPP